MINAATSLSICIATQVVGLKVTVISHIGLSYLKLAIEHEFNYVLFDFSGSGLSEGRYISLGRYR